MTRTTDTTGATGTTRRAGAPGQQDSTDPDLASDSAGRTDRTDGPARSAGASTDRPRRDRRVKTAITVVGADGISRRHYFHGRTKREARQKAEAARQRVATGAPVRDATCTLSEWLAEWRETFLRASDRAESTKSLYSGLTCNHIEPVVGHLRLHQVRPVDVTRVLLSMEAAGRSASTRRSAYAALRSCLDDAVANGLLAANPALRVKRPRADHTEAQSLEPAEVTRLLDGAMSLRYTVVLRFILGTGLRRGEALALRWSDIDLDRGRAKVQGSLVRRAGELIVTAPKSARSRRVISLSPAMVRLLRALRAQQAQEQLLAANLWEQTGFVFTTELGTPVDPRNLLRTVKLACSRADLPALGVHTLRHTYATTALLNGVPMHVVSRNLGHSSIVITVDTYGHLTDDASSAAALAVSDALGL